MFIKMNTRWLSLLTFVVLILKSNSILAESVNINWTISATGIIQYKSIKKELRAINSSKNRSDEDIYNIKPDFNNGICEGEYSIYDGDEGNWSCGACRFKVTADTLTGEQLVVIDRYRDTDNSPFSFPINYGWKYEFKVYTSSISYHCTIASATAKANFNISRPPLNIHGSANGRASMEKIGGERSLGSYQIKWSHQESGSSITNVFLNLTINPMLHPRIEVWLANPSSDSGTIMGRFNNTNPSVILSEPNDGLRIENSTPLFKYNYSDKDSDPQKSFQLEISKNPQFQNIVFDTGVVDSNVNFYELSSNKALTTGSYYWRVRVCDIYGGSGLSDVWSFSNVAEPNIVMNFGDDNELLNGDIFSFQDVNIGEIGNATFRVNNNGSEILQINSIIVNPQDTFWVITPTFDHDKLLIDPGEGVDLALNFAPVKTGRYSATVSIESNDPNNKKFEFNIHGRCYDFTFRYKDYLYSRKGEYIYGKLENISKYWGSEERINAQKRIKDLSQNLKNDLMDIAHREALLDVHYDIALAELGVAQEKVIDSLKISIGINPLVTNEHAINQEIELLEESMNLFKNGLKVYFDLLKDSLGVDTKSIDENVVDDIPFGYYIFSSLVPSRSLYSLLQKNAQDEYILPGEQAFLSSNNHETELIINGYKDLILLIQIEKEYVQTAVRLAKLYLIKHYSENCLWPNKCHIAGTLIGNVLQASYLEVETLLNCFNITDLTNVNWDIFPSQLYDQISGWQIAINQLTFLQAFIHGEANPLGYRDDILVLIQTNLPSTQVSEKFHSFDFLSSYLTDETSGGPLSVALKDLQKAKKDYENYRDRQDQLAYQLNSSREKYDERLREIVGVGFGEPGYDNPAGNKAGEIALQNINIKRAELNFEASQKEVENIKEQINIEINKRGEQQSIKNAITQVILKYGEVATNLSERLSAISAEQLYLNTFFSTKNHSLSEYLSREEKLKGFFQGQLQRISALERAEIYSLESLLLDIESKALIKNMILRMESLLLDTINSALLIEQEYGRLAALISEKQYLEQRRTESNSELAARYFADPSHRLLKDQSIVQAELSFQRAQRWMFLAIKTLEYKWNIKLSHDDSTSIKLEYTSKDLFKLRNANELNNMFNFMKNFDMNMNIGAPIDDAYKKFSLREDFLKYNKDIEAFRYYLSSNVLEVNDPENKMPVKVMRIKFSTVKEHLDFFFRNRWLEKINFLKVKLLGGVRIQQGSTLSGHLTYGGVSYIRNRKHGLIDQNDPDKLIGEMTAYPVNYLFYNPNQNHWQNKTELEKSILIQFNEDPELFPSIYRIESYRECSIANSEWSLYIPIMDLDNNEIVKISEILDIEIHFNFYFYSRVNAN